MPLAPVYAASKARERKAFRLFCAPSWLHSTACILPWSTSMSDAPIGHSCMQAGVVQLVKSLAEPLQKKGIRICALCPQV
jgi:hypothetical protein